MSIATKVVGLLQALYGVTKSVTSSTATVLRGVVTIDSTPSGSATASNFLNVTGTLPTVITANTFGANVQITGAGNSSSQIDGLRVNLIAGYSGSSTTLAINSTNSSAGTGTTIVGDSHNVGFSGITSGATTGTNLGVYGVSSGGNINVGVVGYAVVAKNSAVNVGVFGVALNTGSSPVQVGGYFALRSSDPIITESAGIIVDNAATTSPIALFQDNGTDVVTIADGGFVTATAGIQNTAGRARNTANATNATTTFSSLSDLSLTLTAGRKYTGRVVIKCNNSVAAEGIKFDFNGGAATMTSFWASATESAGGTTVLGTVISTSLAGVINYTTITGETVIEISVSLVCNVGGTLIPRFAENSTTTGTATVELGSFAWLEDSPN